MRYLPRTQLNLGQQLASIRRDFPEGAGVLRGNVLEWTGMLTPSPLGRDYRVRLTYRLGQRPTVRVLDPSLQALAGGRTIPHLYSQEDEELCVYLPGDGGQVLRISWVFEPGKGKAQPDQARVLAGAPGGFEPGRNLDSLLICFCAATMSLETIPN